MYIVKNIFRTLQYRNFRLFFTGQSISLVGTWMQTIAMGWLVYRLTGSAFLLGLVGFSNQIPSFLLSPFAGVMVDRWDCRRILVFTQTLSMIQAFVLAALTLTGAIAVWHIIALGAFLGCVTSLDIPARQSFIVEMVEKKENLGNAIALNSFIFNAARLIGPAIAGILIALTGEGLCFLINGISFLAVIVSLAIMNIKVIKKEDKHSHILKDLHEGFVYAFSFMPIRAIILFLAVVSLMGMSYVILMPVFAKDILHGGPHTLGFLMASGGIGAIVATAYLASRKNILGFGRIIPVSSFIFGLCLIFFSISHVLLLSIILMALAGFGLMSYMAASNTILQTIVDDDKRGRVMSFYAMAFMGMAPLGSLMSGILAAKVGVTVTLAIGGASCIIAAIIFATKLADLKKSIHPVYKKMGIITEPPAVTGQ